MKSKTGRSDTPALKRGLSQSGSKKTKKTSGKSTPQYEAIALSEANKALRKSESTLRSIFQASTVGILIVTPDRKISWMNDRITLITGYTLKEIQDRGPRIFYATDDEFARVGRLVFEEVVQGRPMETDIKWVRKDGAIRDIHLSVTLIDPNDTTMGQVSIVTDVTAQKAAEKKLIESEERYRTAIEHSNDGITLVRKDKIVYVNQKFLYIFGYDKPEEVVGKSPTIFIHPDDRLLVRNYRIQRQRGEIFPKEYEHKGVKKDGTMIFIEVSIAETMYRGEQVAFVYQKDITERKRAEEVLKGSEEHFRALVEKSSEVIFLINENWKRMYVSPPIIRILGYTAEEFLSLGLGEFTHPDDTIAVNTAWSHILANPGETVTFTNRLRHKDGSWRWVETTTRNLLNEPSVSSLVANFHDITESKLAEEALQESEAKYRNVVDNLIVGYYVIQDNCFRFVNRRFCEMSGYSYDELMDKINPLDLIHDDDKKFFAEVMVQRLAGEIDYAGSVYKGIRKDGQVIIIKGLSSLLIYNGRPAVAGTIIDITREKTLESQLQQSQKMEAIGTLAGGIAHDFNNILTAIIGYGRLLQMKMSEADPLRAYVAQVLSSSEKAASLTRNLLTFSRKQIVELKPVKVGKIVKGMERLLKSLLMEDIELKIISPDSDLIIMADVSQIEQILLNLASNANDAMPRGGKLTIETKEIEMKNVFVDGYDYIESGQYVLISVADRGTGIDEKTRNKIFEPFFTTKEVGKGTGLGLSIVHGIVDQHHGYITVDSKLQDGTVFNIYFPAVKTAIEETKAISPELEGGSETILVAEDDEQVRGLTVEILNSAGYTVIEAVDGVDAMEKFIEHSDTVELLLLDVVMPKKNGKEAYDEIKKTKPDIRVIFMSGYTGDVIITKGIFEREYSFIQKPLAPDALLHLVREAFGK